MAIPEMVERRTDYRPGQNVGLYDRRRILWRLGFFVGRTLVGVEVQQVVALRDYLALQPAIDEKRIGVLGVGQRGMTALYAAAVDQRLAAATVLDYFEQRELCWKEPVDRMIYGQLNEFGDAEVAALITPRPLMVATSWKLSRTGHPGELVVDFGSQQGARDLGESQIDENEVSPGYGRWCELKLVRPIRLDPRKLYWFAVRSLPGPVPGGAYGIYGPKPPGGNDYPHKFGLSFRMLTRKAEQSAKLHIPAADNGPRSQQ